MKIEQLKQILNNKINNLEQMKQVHFSNGDIENYNNLELEILETRATINKLGE